MGIISGLILGALAGWIASKITGNDKKTGTFLNILIGIVGGTIGSLVMRFFGGVGVTGFNLWSLFVSVIGAVILLWIMNTVNRR